MQRADTKPNFLEQYYVAVVEQLNAIKISDEEIRIKKRQHPTTVSDAGIVYKFAGPDLITLESLTDAHKAQLLSRLLVVFDEYCNMQGQPTATVINQEFIHTLANWAITKPNSNPSGPGRTFLYTDKPMLKISSVILEFPGNAAKASATEAKHTDILLGLLDSSDSAATIIKNFARYRSADKHESYDVVVSNTADGSVVTIGNLFGGIFQGMYRTRYKEDYLVGATLEEKTESFIKEMQTHYADPLKILQKKLLAEEANIEKAKAAIQTKTTDAEKLHAIEKQSQEIVKVLSEQISELQNKLDVLNGNRHEIEKMFEQQFYNGKFNSGSTYFAKQQALTLAPFFHEPTNPCLLNFSKKVECILKRMQKFEQSPGGYESITAGISGNAMHYLLTAIRYFQVSNPEEAWLIGSEFSPKLKQSLNKVREACINHLVGVSIKKPVHHSELEVQIAFEFILEICKQHPGTIGLNSTTNIVQLSIITKILQDAVDKFPSEKLPQLDEELGDIETKIDEGVSDTSLSSNSIFRSDSLPEGVTVKLRTNKDHIA